MINWHYIRAPAIAALILFSLIPILLVLLTLIISQEQTILLEWELTSFRGLTIRFPILTDKVALIFRIAVVLISFRVILFTVTYISGDINLEYFIYIVMLFVLSINLLIFIPRIIILLLGWDGLGLTSYLLVVYYQRDKSLRAGIITALTNRIGDALLILAGSWIFLSGHWNFTVSQIHVTGFIIGAVLLAAMTKRAQMPFSAWLPAAIAAPTPVSSLVHSSTLVTAGVYLLFRFYPSLTTFVYFESSLFYIGVLTCLMARLSATYENDLKKIIALSTLRQLGLIMIALGLGQPILAFFHLVTHALFKALLFICAGTIIHRKQNNQDIRLIGNIWNSIPVTCTALNVANLALCGFPFIAGFYSKDLIVETFILTSLPITTRVLMILRVCLTSAYRLRLSFFTLWSPFKSPSTTTTNDESIITYTPCFILILGATCGGATLIWLIAPSSQNLILPLPLKVLTLSLITILGVAAYYISYNRITLPTKHFIATIWFLTFISSSPQVRKTLSLGNKIYTQELTWIELARGKGLANTFTNLSQKLQQTTNMQFSQLLSLISALFIITLLIY